MKVEDAVAYPVTATASMAITGEAAAAEVDCPWFDNNWRDDHPEFPLSVRSRTSRSKGVPHAV